MVTRSPVSSTHDSPSSVDFCEPNYASSYYVAEPLNTFSALPYLFLGWHGWRTVDGGQRWERVPRSRVL